LELSQFTDFVIDHLTTLWSGGEDVRLLTFCMMITSYDYVMSYCNDVCASDSETIDKNFVEVSVREDPV